MDEKPPQTIEKTETASEAINMEMIEKLEKQASAIVSEIMQESPYVKTETDEDFSSIYNMKDVHAFIRLILQHYGTLTIYVIEPYVEQNMGDPMKIPAGENYTIYDYGGRLVVTANDIFATSLFACSEFLKGVEQALQMILDAGATEIAILGDQRAKLFIWDRCDRLKTIENVPINVINFNPAEPFLITREAVLRYLREHGMTPKTRPTATPPK